MSETVINLVDCSEADCSYGILVMKNVSTVDVRDMIYSIKNDKDFKAEFSDGWQLDDILNRFPKNWEWKFYSSVGTLVI